MLVNCVIVCASASCPYIKSPVKRERFDSEIDSKISSYREYDPAGLNLTVLLQLSVSFKIEIQVAFNSGLSEPKLKQRSMTVNKNTPFESIWIEEVKRLPFTVIYFFLIK